MAKRVLSIRISEELYEELQRRAKEEGLTLTQYVERLLRQAMGMREARLERIESTLLDLIDIVDELADELERCCEDVTFGLGIKLRELRQKLQQAQTSTS